MIDIQVEAQDWLTALPQAEALAERAAAAALALAKRRPQPGLAVLLTDDEAVQGLNGRFRGKAGPTNVLSFPALANPENHLGDVALAFGVCAREAEAQGKPLAHHLSHLVAHGVLHLLGYDHETEAEAEAMEEAERLILEPLGVPDPYSAERDLAPHVR